MSPRSTVFGSKPSAFVFRKHVFCLSAVFCLWLMTSCHPSARADSTLEREFMASAQRVLETLRNESAQTVGVLKFSVRVGDGKFPGNVGRLNNRLAEKLELALVLANPAGKTSFSQQVGVVRGASDVATTIAGASHLTDDGRRALFSKPYPLAWKHNGQATAKPDAFVVGVAQVSRDLATLRVELMLLKRNDLKLSSLGGFSAPVDVADLMDGGESFTTRGLFDDGKVQLSQSTVTETIRKEAVQTRFETLEKSKPTRAEQHPLAIGSRAPIGFEICYDGKVQPYEFRNGTVFVKEPLEGQKVTLNVRRRGGDRGRYGVLIRVNGENTLYRERKSDAQSTMWIFEPQLDEFSLSGYQIDERTLQKFQVYSDAESATRAFDYGKDVGMISVTVYPELKGPRPTPNDAELELVVQSEARLPDQTAESRGELGSSLFDQLLTQTSTRGLIGEGQSEESELNFVNFKPAQTPIMSAAVRYYKP